MNKLMKKILGLTLGLAMSVGTGVAVASNREAVPVHAADSTVTYTATSISAVSTSGTAVDGSSATLSSTGSWNSSSVQMTNGKNMSLTITGYAGYTITGLSVSVRSNSSKGTGSLTFTIGGTTKASIAESAFNSANWYGNWSTSFVTVTPTLTSTTVGTGQNMVLTIACKSGSSNYNSLYFKSVTLTYKSAKTELTGITLGGAASQNAMSIGSSDTTAKTVSVTLNPTNATDQKVNIVHQSGTSGLFTVSSSATCTSGSGSFTVTGKGNTSGYETFRISGNTETSVYVDLVVTALDDSVTYWTVSFDSAGGASIADKNVEDGETFEFPSPGTKTHHSFDGWSSDGGNTLYDVGEESPAVDADIEYTAYWTEDAKYTVTYVHGDHGTGNDYVVNNVYGGSYTLVTFATTGFNASSGYVFKKWSVGGVEYAEGAEITISGATTVTALYSEVTAYTLVTNASDLVEGTQFILLHASTNSLAIGAWNSSYFTTVSTASVSGSQAVCDDAMVFTLEGSSGAWKVKCGDYYYGLQNSTSALRATSASGNNYSWTISITNGIASMKTAGSGTRSLSYNSSTTPPRYSAYTASSTYTEVRMFAIIPEVNELDSVTTSGQNTSFTAGNKWSYGGTLTAHYTVEPDATVTATSYKFGDFGINPTTAGTAITTDTTLDHDTHNGKYIYVIYTEDNITKYCSYQITVNYAPITSVTIDPTSASIGKNSTFNTATDVEVTILPENADQSKSWSVTANTVDNDYTFVNGILTSGETEGTITLTVTPSGDETKATDLVVTVSADPVVHLKEDEINLYSGKTAFLEFDSADNMGTITSYSWEVTEGSSYVEITEGASTSKVTLGYIDEGDATVKLTVSDGSREGYATATVHAIDDVVISVDWSATNFDVYSGNELTDAIDDIWEVNYKTKSDDGDYLLYGDYDLYLDDTIIELPHTWSVDDDGSEMHVEYEGVSSSIISISVCQTLRPIYKEIPGETKYSNLVFTKESQEGPADDGAEYTIESDGPNSDFDSSRGIHYGTSKVAVSELKLSSSAFISKKIKKVEVNASGASKTEATISCTVGGSSFGTQNQSLTSSAATYTFNGSASGELVVSLNQESDKKALYVKSVIVMYEEASQGSVDIANKAGHSAAQKAVVKFAKAFNTAMDTTANCSTNMSTAWTEASGAWTTFLSEAAALGTTEEAYAKDLVAWATAQHTKDTDNNFEYCLERAMATYEICVTKHGKTPFMNDVRSASPVVNKNILESMTSGSTIAIVVVSVLAVTAIGGYFFIRKRKELN